MYPVSDLYRQTMAGGVLQNRVAGTITLKDGRTVAFDDGNIVSGSLSIDNKCINNNEFGLGAVYIGQMGVTLFGVSVNRYALYGAEVRLSYFLTLTDGTEEEIPLGVYFVTEPVKTRRLISLTCYDAMHKLDITVEEDSWGTPYAMLSLVCSKAGIELGNTEGEITAMHNGEAVLSLMTERVQTYRDFVSYITSVLGGFATIDRQGRLCVRQFHTEPDLTIPASGRTKSTICDYETYFNAITARFIAEENFYPYSESDKERTDGLLLDLGDIPIVQGIESYKHTILHNILTVAEQVRYTPAELELVPDPSIDLGDLLTLEHANGMSESVVSLVTAISWTYRKAHKVISSGSDALLSAVSDKNAKQLADMEAQLASKNLVVKTYTNATDFALNGQDQNIIRMSWSAFEKTTAVFGATIPIELSADGNLVLTYQNGMETKGTVTKYLARGKHFVTITNYIPSETNERVSWRVNARLEAFASDSRQQNAKIVSILDYIENGSYTEHAADLSAPAGTIGQEQIRAWVFAQGLNATEAWDGTLELSDEVSTVAIKTDFEVIRNITEQVAVSQLAPQRSGLTDTVGLISFGKQNFVMAVRDYPLIEEVRTKQTCSFVQTDYTESTEYIVTQLKTEYAFESTAEAIDKGYLSVVDIKTGDKQEITEIEIEVTPNAD